MGRLVHGSDFSDEQIAEFFGNISRIDWSTLGEVPEWVSKEATAFVTNPPRPSAAEFRLHVDHAVAVAIGWDHPDNPQLMLASATKSFYVIAWLEHLQHHQPSRKGQIDLSLGLRVTFVPVMANGFVTDSKSLDD